MQLRKIPASFLVGSSVFLLLWPIVFAPLAMEVPGMAESIRSFRGASLFLTAAFLFFLVFMLSKHRREFDKGTIISYVVAIAFSTGSVVLQRWAFLSGS